MKNVHSSVFQRSVDSFFICMLAQFYYVSLLPTSYTFIGLFENLIDIALVIPSPCFSQPGLSYNIYRFSPQQGWIFIFSCKLMFILFKVMCAVLYTNSQTIAEMDQTSSSIFVYKQGIKKKKHEKSTECCSQTDLHCSCRTSDLTRFGCQNRSEIIRTFSIDHFENSQRVCECFTFCGNKHTVRGKKCLQVQLTSLYSLRCWNCGAVIILQMLKALTVLFFHSFPFLFVNNK